MATINDLPPELLTLVLRNYLDTIDTTDWFQAYKYTPQMAILNICTVSKVWCDITLQLLGTRYGDKKWGELRWGVLGRFTSYLIHVNFQFDEEERRHAYRMFMEIRDGKAAMGIRGRMSVPGFEEADVAIAEET
ncbi:hypothetical protein PMZ80_006786 [Knufia obscura]|uniref:F-box domain-containing protein n=2 Tax=Knufia TaxID=430999 RepID=A0AAN8EIX2_9EURO|nr:hypothetical protein PMZ80_006786 [Knufia obscura]KAK5948106.1 hypothetical protein OHC33_010854 [Knufia fluminis]